MEGLSIDNINSRVESSLHSDLDNEKVSLINPYTRKEYPRDKKEFKQSLPYHQNPNFQYLDKIIETISFSKYHLATLLVCSFSIMCGGFVTTHYIFSKNLLMKRYTWTLTEYSLIFIFQNIVGAVGAFISVTSTTNTWDIHSNILIGLVGLLSIILMTFYNDSPLYIILIMIFNYCQGFINNICCNFLLEEFKFKYRELAFLLVNSLRLIGYLLFGIFESIIYDKYNNEDPIMSIVCLAVLQLGLVISLAFFYDSPRLLYYNSHYEKLYKYIEATTPTHDLSKYASTIMKKIKSTRKELDTYFPSQKYEDFLKHFVQLWHGPYLILSLKAIIFVFLSTFLMSNIKDSYSYYLDDSSQYLFIIVDENAPHYKICYYYICVFAGIIGIVLIKYYLNLPRKLLSLISLAACFVFLILMILINKHFLYFLGVFEAFACFYYMMVYMYFSTYITTQLRNSMTSLLYIIMSISYIFQSALINSMKNYTLFGYLNFGVTIILAFLEAFVLGDDTKNLQLQEIEITLLRANSKYENEHEKI